MAHTAQGAPAPISASPIITTPSELVVILDPHWEAVDFYGTRDMLEAEGVIPDGAEWPTGFNNLKWQDDKFKYWLYRKRPEGAKGPRRMFLDVDWWRLMWRPIEGTPLETLQLRSKLKELADIQYRHSPAYVVESRRYWDSVRDEAFQKFKALVPGLVRPRRGRKPKAKAAIKQVAP